MSVGITVHCDGRVTKKRWSHGRWVVAIPCPERLDTGFTTVGLALMDATNSGWVVLSDGEGRGGVRTFCGPCGEANK